MTYDEAINYGSDSKTLVRSFSPPQVSLGEPPCRSIGIFAVSFQSRTVLLLPHFDISKSAQLFELLLLRGYHISTIMATERQGHHGPSTFEGKSLVDPNTRPAWFTEVVESIPDVGRRLLEDYSGIAPKEVLPHVIHIVSPL